LARDENRIAVTHVGSLPRPPRLGELALARTAGEEVDASEFERLAKSAVEDHVRHQRDAGVDIISDGEAGKSNFSTYVAERYSGFGGSSEFEMDDLAPFPNLANKLFGRLAGFTMPNCIAPVVLTDPEAVHQDIARLAGAIGDQPQRAFMNAVSPGQVSFNCPNQYYKSHEDYLAALAEVLRYEYKAIIDAGFDLQIDSPDLAMSAHQRSKNTDLGSWETHVPLAIEAMNAAIEGLPAERLRLHICWGNYQGPHHYDVELKHVLTRILKANVGALSIEGANGRHEHEWEVFKEIKLPDDKVIITGAIEVRQNTVEHPRLVAQRLIRLAGVIGRDRVIAGTDCGFSTAANIEYVEPEIVWLKLESLSQGAAMASAELW
jgi:5-methyltetrahydropteroyltriglutamate--homocysteine methyltransferase